jgi:gamma-glutamyltranspeptidase/glutathione hydrolase
MSPTIVFDHDGDVFMVTGSPGGHSIVGYVARSLAAVLDWDHTAQEASSLPNIVAREEEFEGGADPRREAVAVAIQRP